MEWTRKSEFELHPAGEFRAQFVEWSEDKHEKFGIQVKLSFDTEAAMDDGQPYRISTWCKPSLHKKSKVSKLLAAMGVDTEKMTDDEVKRFDLDDYIGKRIRLTITHEAKKEGDGEVHKITGFLPYKKAPVRTVAAFDDDPETSGDRAAQEAPAAEKREPVGAATGNGKKGKAAAPSTPEPNWDEED